jgi:hypothetical protein
MNSVQKEHRTILFVAKTGSASGGSAATGIPKTLVTATATRWRADFKQSKKVLDSRMHREELIFPLQN